MLVNLSNHPSTNWGTEQRDAARVFGPVVDVPFPPINPHDDTAAVAALVTEYVARINSLFAAHVATLGPEEEDTPTRDGVHLMGETSFIIEFALQWHSGAVREPLYCSTTAREVVELPDGTKQSTFRFVQFRPMGGR